MLDNLDNLDLGVITGDKSLKVEAVITNEQLTKVGIVVFIAFFVSGLLSAIIAKKL